LVEAHVSFVTERTAFDIDPRQPAELAELADEVIE